MKFSINSTDELPLAAEKLLTIAGDRRVILFFGDMGAGKTTFIKAICAALGVVGEVSSPTFSIINEYYSPQGPIFHFDFYRLKEEEAFDIGVEEYFFSGKYCFVEWPDNIPNLLPSYCVDVEIEIFSETQREIEIEAN